MTRNNSISQRGTKLNVYTDMDRFWLTCTWATRTWTFKVIWIPPIVAIRTMTTYFSIFFTFPARNSTTMTKKLKFSKFIPDQYKYVMIGRSLGVHII